MLFVRVSRAVAVLEEKVSVLPRDDPKGIVPPAGNVPEGRDCAGGISTGEDFVRKGHCDITAGKIDHMASFFLFFIYVFYYHPPPPPSPFWRQWGVGGSIVLSVT